VVYRLVCTVSAKIKKNQQATCRLACSYYEHVGTLIGGTVIE